MSANNLQIISLAIKIAQLFVIRTIQSKGYPKWRVIAHHDKSPLSTHNMLTKKVFINQFTIYQQGKDTDDTETKDICEINLV